MSFRGGRDGDTAGSEAAQSSHRRPLEVTVGDRGVEGAIRLFKRIVLREGILRDLKRRAHYEKPGDRRRRKAREAVRRQRKQRAKAIMRGEQVD